MITITTRPAIYGLGVMLAGALVSTPIHAHETGWRSSGSVVISHEIRDEHRYPRHEDRDRPRHKEYKRHGHGHGHDREHGARYVPAREFHAVPSYSRDDGYYDAPVRGTTIVTIRYVY
ncbi:MAG: hypothetical protein FD165_1820 [Gammaproteobacteria bacterium]|nr:MAG: hypothetical protein FD165_1820 [Gammaproteobacteria bacterium]TND04394.1 MAG: hypothetical protein FD120_1508 [Gammaproteobacteria bacterium]